MLQMNKKTASNLASAEKGYQWRMLWAMGDGDGPSMKRGAGNARYDAAGMDSPQSQSDASEWLAGHSQG